MSISGVRYCYNSACPGSFPGSFLGSLWFIGASAAVSLAFVAEQHLLFGLMPFINGCRVIIK